MNYFYKNCIRQPHPTFKMPAITLKRNIVNAYYSFIKAIGFSEIIFFHQTAADYDYFDTTSEHTEPNSTRPGWNGPCVFPLKIVSYRPTLYSH